METAKPRELNTLHVGQTRKMHGSKSDHGVRKWNSSLHQAFSLKSFRTAFTHKQWNCITGEGNDSANARMFDAYEKVFDCVFEQVTTHVRNQKDIGRRSSWCLFFIRDENSHEMHMTT